MRSSREMVLPPFSRLSIRNAHTCLHLHLHSYKQARRIYDNVDVDEIDPGKKEVIEAHRDDRHVWIDIWYDNMDTAIKSTKKAVQPYAELLLKPAILTVGSTNAYDGDTEYLGKVKFCPVTMAKSTSLKPPVTSKDPVEIVDSTVYHKFAPKGELRELFINRFRGHYGLIVNGLLRSCGIDINELDDDTKEIMLRYGCSIKQCDMILDARVIGNLFDNYGEAYDLSPSEMLCLERAALDDDNTRDETQ